MKDVIRDFVPPLLWRGARAVYKRSRARSAPGSTDLFDGEGALFLSALDGVTHYLEYGLGASTAWIDQHSDAIISGVDSSRYWLDKVVSSLSRTGHRLSFVDIGPVGDWGWPQDFSGRGRYLDYVEGPWAGGFPADLVLIDGRFRISCFLTALMRAPSGCRIVFDDYTHRPAYHVVEEFLRPISVSNRQALFEVPQARDIVHLGRNRDAFLMVRD